MTCWRKWIPIHHLLLFLHLHHPHVVLHQLGVEKGMLLGDELKEEEGMCVLLCKIMFITCTDGREALRGNEVLLEGVVVVMVVL